MEPDRLNQLLRENPDYLKEFSNDVFNHFTENTDLFKTREISGFQNLEDSFREEALRSKKDPSILRGALQGVYNDFLDDYRRRGGESIQLFNWSENIKTEDFFDSLKDKIKEQIIYYSNPKHQNSMFTKYYVDNILPSNETSLAKTLTNIDKTDKTIKLAETTSMERENAKREHEIHEQKEKELHEKLFGNGSKSFDGMTLDEYINGFKSVGKSADPNDYTPKMTSDEYKNFKKMPDGEFRGYIEKLASGTPQEDKKAIDILNDIGFYEANPRKVERFSQAQMRQLETARKAASADTNSLDRQLEIARKTGYVQGVCECVAAIGDNHALGKKLLSEMNVTKDLAKKFTNPQIYKTLEQGIFAQQQKIEQTHGIKR